jgi:Holliday junction DNA helicase RuvA
MPLGAVGRVPMDAEGTQTVFVHTVVREDALDLFGFSSEVERACFRVLISVPNVGPKTALGVLSFLSPPELAAAIEAEDIGRLSKTPGIGKRTAERIVVELKGKLGAWANATAGQASKPTSVKNGNAERLTVALTNMGYRPAEAARAVELLGDAVVSKSVTELLREALAILSR